MKFLGSRYLFVGFNLEYGWLVDQDLGPKDLGFELNTLRKGINR